MTVANAAIVYADEIHRLQSLIVSSMEQKFVKSLFKSHPVSWVTLNSYGILLLFTVICLSGDIEHPECLITIKHLHIFSI